MEWPQAKAVIASARFLTAVVEKCPELLTSNLWDATIISLSSWMLTVKNSQHLLLLPSKHGILPLVPKALTTEATQSSVPSDKCQKLSALSESGQMADSFCLDSNSETVFAVAIFQLYKALSNFMAGPHDDSDVKMFHEKLKVEWTDVFANDVHEAIVSTFYAITGKFHCLTWLIVPDVTVCIPFNIHHFKKFCLLWFYFL